MLLVFEIRAVPVLEDFAQAVEVLSPSGCAQVVY